MIIIKEHEGEYYIGITVYGVWKPFVKAGEYQKIIYDDLNKLRRYQKILDDRDREASPIGIIMILSVTVIVSLIVFLC